MSPHCFSKRSGMGLLHQMLCTYYSSHPFDYNQELKIRLLRRYHGLISLLSVLKSSIVDIEGGVYVTHDEKVQESTEVK